MTLRAKSQLRPVTAHLKLICLTIAVSLATGPAPVAAATETSKPAASQSAKPAKATKKTAQTKKSAQKSTKKTSKKKEAKNKSKKKVVAQKPRHKLAVVSSTFLSKSDLDAAVASFAEADRKHWPAAMANANRVSNPVAKKIIQWNRLMAEDSGATTSEILAFQEQNPDWPRQAILSQRAEQALLAYPLTDKAAVEWFNAHPPLTGEGKMRFGKALIANGKAEDGKTWIRRAWQEDDFSQGRQREILATYGSYLNTATHRARLERLLWDGRAADARLTASLIGDSAQALTDARLKLADGTSNAPTAVSRVPSSLRNDPGLLFDQIRFQRRRGNDDAVLPLILSAPDEAHTMVDPHAWWIERKIAARTALSEGKFNDAYKIVSGHGLKQGPDFAEAAFMSGWIALQYLNKPDKALEHFINLKNNVSTPISASRAEYWCGRAAEAKGDKNLAKVYYTQASLYPTTFYGQLGAAALSPGGSAKLTLTRDPNPTAEQRATFKKLELVYAAQVLHDLGRETQTWSFMLHLADILNDPEQLAELSDLALTFDDPKLSLRIAKTASQRNIVMTERAYPLSRIPAYTERGPRVEKALVLGLSRQESEFDPAAYSSAGALGLMQLMPATARIVAKQISVPYSQDRLTSDPAYNAMLGSAHLGDLIDGYSGSYIMSIAAYNAGKSRIGTWTEQYGDPRSKAVDPIDWVESIPFSETRNYVQRVMENVEIYRTRLSGSPQTIKLGEDLRRYSGTPFTTPAPFARTMTPAPQQPPAQVITTIAQPGKDAQPGATIEQPSTTVTQNLADTKTDQKAANAPPRIIMTPIPDPPTSDPKPHKQGKQ